LEIEGKVTVVNTHPSESIDVDELRRLAAHVLRSEGASVEAVSIILCDHARHGELHRRYLGREYETDVLAFTLGTNDAIEGEVYVDIDTARERHAEFAETLNNEIRRYMIHGILHLLGYEDGTVAESEQMHRLEEQYMRSLDR
jgi:rRNA maturation RNase YbeY